MIRPEIQIIEIKQLNCNGVNWAREKGEMKKKDDPTMLLKTNVEKMSLCGSATILMKTNELYLLCHDVDEKKRS